jgi:hypothetical protein
MSGTLYFVNNLAGNSNTKEQTAQKALIRSHVMKRFRREQREQNMQQQALSVAASRDNSPRPSSVRTDHGQTPGYLEDCADCSPDRRCDLHRIQLQYEDNYHNTSPSTEEYFTASCVTRESSGFPASTRDSIVSSHDRRGVNPHALGQGTTVVPPTMHSPSAWREPLLASYVQGLFPSRDLRTPVLVERLHHWGGGKNLSMLLINDALCMMQSGITFQDHRIFIEGHKRQVLAVQSLRDEISRPGVSIQEVSTSAINIMCSGIYSATSSGLAGCASHIAGVTAILEAHGRHSNSEPLTPQLRRNFQRLILMHHLINSKAISISDRILGADQKGMPGSVEELIRLSLRLPGLMEATSNRFDKVFDEGPGSETQALQALASTLAGELDDWLQAYEEPIVRNRPAPCEFLGSVDANMLGLYWSVRLLLAESRDRLQMMQSVYPADDVHNLQCYKEEADMYATYLLDTAVTIDRCEGPALSKAFVMRAPLHFARNWWTFSADKERLDVTLRLERRLRAGLPQIDWDTLLYWSFLPMLWLV